MVAAATLEFDLMGRIAVLFAFLTVPLVAAADLQVVVIEGLGGESLYVDQFSEQVDAVESATSAMTTSDRVTIFRNGDFTRDTIVDFFATLNDALTPDDSLAVFLIGHGSFDEHQYKFNLSGPDLTDDDLKAMLDSVPAETQLLVNTSSASGAIRENLETDKRTLILATRSGVERHATRFGSYFAAGLTDATADVDKNSIITAAEAFEFAARQVADFYDRNGQLATEHPHLAGSDADRFGLARLGARKSESDNPELRELLSRRDSLNATIDELRLRRDQMSPDDYQSELLQNMLELATLEESIETVEAAEQ